MELIEVINDVANALVAIDSLRVPYRSFRLGVGPYGEPQLLKLVADFLNTLPKYKRRVLTKRTPDLLIPYEWAIEFKIVRPYGDNGKEAENWSVNLLHPYQGNVSTIGDCYKLAQLQCPERVAVAVIGYEHNPPRIDLIPLVASFEAIIEQVTNLTICERIETQRDNLVHPVHQSLRVFAWEVIKQSNKT